MSIIEAGVGGFVSVAVFGIIIGAIYLVYKIIANFFANKKNLELTKKFNKGEHQKPKVIRSGNLSTKDKLIELKKLYEDKLISEENYKQEQRKILEEDE